MLNLVILRLPTNHYPIGEIHKNNLHSTKKLILDTIQDPTRGGQN